MAPRISRGSLPAPKLRLSGKSNRKRKLRSLDAFSIAGKQEPEVSKVRQNRLGEAEGGAPRRKRQRLDNSSDGEDEPQLSNAEQSEEKTLPKGRFDELDISGGSDSEGNEWRLGHLNDDDDSDVDSDEAFGESDEERFEGFTFRGSSSGKLRTDAARVNKRKEVSINEINLDEAEEKDDEESEGDWGEDAVDLATMLDASDESDNGETVGHLQEQNRKLENRQSQTTNDKSQEKTELGDEFDGFDESEDDDVVNPEDELTDSDEDEESVFSESEADSEGNDVEKLQQIQDLVASLPKNLSDGNLEEPKTNEQNSFRNTDWQKGFEMMSGLDPTLSRAFKSLARSNAHSRKDKSDSLVKVPLPKRQQDRLDRAAAYHKAKETLNRWIDTVKHNRRAEHLSFPLKDPQAHEAQGMSRLLPIGNTQPRTELEDTIHNILRESGMAGKSEEEQIRGFEELQAKRMPLEEVLARRAELRKARELLFREEVRSRRIKKIKSKSYRRVHRKDQQKAAQKERDELAAAGVEMSGEERENQDRRRAAERMGGRHRESRWAKTIKQSGRAAWDEDARSGVTEMARKNEELRQRMEGKQVRREDESNSELSSDNESEGDGTNESDGGSSGEQFKLRKQLTKVGPDVSFKDGHSRLASMKFMQRADAARRQRNDEEVEQLRRELDDEESQAESETETALGRRIFGPRQESSFGTQPAVSTNEFEEGSASEAEDEKANESISLIREDVTLDQNPQPKGSANKTSHTKGQLKTPGQAIAHASNLPPSQTKPKNFQITSVANHKNAPHSVETTAPPNINNWATIPPSAFSSKDANSEPNNPDHLTPDPEPFLLPTNLSLVQSAFATDDAIESSFTLEKHAATTSEADKLTSTALPGWGSWTGEGISKRSLLRDAKRNARNPHLVSTEAGVKPADRRDAKLKGVIVSEKRVKKNAKYLASTLPHPFESRQQYERSLRIPMGPEWTTKESFQSATKPRVLLKQGIVKPMQRPML